MKQADLRTGKAIWQELPTEEEPMLPGNEVADNDKRQRGSFLALSQSPVCYLFLY